MYTNTEHLCYQTMDLFFCKEWIYFFKDFLEGTCIQPIVLRPHKLSFAVFSQALGCLEDPFARFLESFICKH